MWKLLILLIAVSVTADEEDVANNEDVIYVYGCRSEVYDRCPVDDSPRDFPGTEEELDEACKFALKYFECGLALIDRTNQCDEDEADFVQFMREMNRNAIRICNNDSLLYRDLGDSLPCFKKNFTTTIMACRRMHEEGILEAFSEVLSSNGITNLPVTDSEQNPCLKVLYGVGCFASQAAIACGDVARGVVIDIAQGFDMPFEQCPPGVKQHIPAIVTMMQLETEKQEDVENAIKKRK